MPFVIDDLVGLAAAAATGAAWFAAAADAYQATQTQAGHIADAAAASGNASQYAQDAKAAADAASSGSADAKAAAEAAKVSADNAAAQASDAATSAATAISDIEHVASLITQEDPYKLRRCTKSPAFYWAAQPGILGDAIYLVDTPPAFDYTDIQKGDTPIVLMNRVNPGYLWYLSNGYASAVQEPGIIWVFALDAQKLDFLINYLYHPTSGGTRSILGDLVDLLALLPVQFMPGTP